MEPNITKNSTSTAYPVEVVARSLVTFACIGIFFALSFVFVISKYCTLSAQRLLLLNQGISGLLVCSAVLWKVALKLNTNFDENALRCYKDILSTAVCYSLNVTILNLMAISVEHFVAMKFSLRYQTLVTTKKTLTAIVLMYVVCISACVFDVLAVKFIWVTGRCAWQIQIGESGSFPGSYMILVILNFILVVIIAIVYGQIFYRALKWRKRMTELGEHRYKPYKAMTSFYVIVTFIVSFWAFFASDVYINTNYKREKGTLIKIWQMVCLFFPVVNTICDVIIYAVRVKQAKLAYRLCWWDVKFCLCLLCGIDDPEDEDTAEDGSNVSRQASHFEMQPHPTIKESDFSGMRRKTIRDMQ